MINAALLVLDNFICLVLLAVQFAKVNSFD